MVFLVLSGKMTFLFPENIILFFRRKRKDDLSQKKIYGIMIFSSNVLKDGLSKKNTLEYGLFCITWKDGTFFLEKHDIFSLDGKWKMIFLEKLMEIWYFLYMCMNVRNMILPFWKKKKKKKIKYDFIPKK